MMHSLLVHRLKLPLKQTNAIGSDEETSNAVTPSAPNPEGSAGPITGVASNPVFSNDLTGIRDSTVATCI